MLCNVLIQLTVSLICNYILVKPVIIYKFAQYDYEMLRFLDNRSLQNNLDK